MSDTAERDLQILEHIHTSRYVRQRDLAHVVGISLGMTNSILKRLAQKGLITIRKINNRTVRYAVSPAGLDELARRSYRYLRRTIRNVVDYKKAIEDLLAGVRRAGYSRLVLAGRSDLDFVIEHVCGNHALEFVQARESVEPGQAHGGFVLYSERVAAPRSAGKRDATEETGRAYLGDLLVSWRPHKAADDAAALATDALADAADGA